LLYLIGPTTHASTRDIVWVGVERSRIKEVEGKQQQWFFHTDGNISTTALVVCGQLIRTRSQCLQVHFVHFVMLQRYPISAHYLGILLWNTTHKHHPLKIDNVKLIFIYLFLLFMRNYWLVHGICFYNWNWLIHNKYEMMSLNSMPAELWSSWTLTHMQCCHPCSDSIMSVECAH
jgi:hypothetical protein